VSVSTALAVAAVVAVVGAAAAVSAERATRRLLERRLLGVLATVVAVPGGAVVELPPGRLVPDAARGRLEGARVTAPLLVLGDLALHAVHLELRDVRWDARLRVLGGVGALTGHLPRAGAPDRVRLVGGRAALTVAGLTIRLRPVLDGDRIRLRPTPFAVRLPPLPPGVRLDGVEARDDQLHVAATIDLGTLLDAGSAAGSA
jgi:hypothetical protein